MTDERPSAAIILAAGAGTRMKSALPKVLHSIGGRSLVGHAIAAVRETRPERVAVVVRHERDLVAAHLGEIAPDVIVAEQDEIPGTGRAVACGLAALDEAAAGPLTGTVLVTSGDVPLVDGGTLAELVSAHTADGNAVTLLTTIVSDPTGYGRVVREPETGDVLRIVEHGDADDRERAISEINAGLYAFDAGALREALTSLERDNAQGEVYLTDVVAQVREAGGQSHALISDEPQIVEGVNDREQLARAGAALNARVLERWMAEGVTIVDPATTWIDIDVVLSADVTLLPGTQLQGVTSVSAGATIGPDTTLRDCTVGEGAIIVRSHGTGASIEKGAVVGPFSYLRPGTRLGADGKIGAFVETKNATIGVGSKVPHLSYVGDATIGEGTNIGAGTIVANYNGVTKHHTTVGDHVRIGSDNTLVAPVTIGDGAYTGAGSTIRRNVPPGALAFNISSQENREGWVESNRPGSPSAEAAAESAKSAGRTQGTEKTREGTP
ncbi:MAG: bifunctional UDP-N-acetylglucosamine diphosphorylase/glucosamine-1-phosphate N-acetyltransferase GlmU [Demequinaceae bacterium]|nr:bifunctional UDP-N-acetylglucosamine diphosphorylase/glucosamine-1-phosphate N-acetyltransferase GlmU [Demequinaceae bacterium]